MRHSISCFLLILVALTAISAITCPRSARADDVADDAEIAQLLDRMEKKTPRYVIDVAFEPATLNAYLSKLKEVAKAGGLSSRSRNMSPDPDNVFVEIWGRGTFATSIYRDDNAPKNYTICVYAESDASAIAAADVLLVKITEALVAVQGVKVSVEK